MDGIRQWAFSACVAMVTCGIARLILPKGNLQKVFSITVSVFFLCCLLLPIAVEFPNIQIQTETYSQEEIERRAKALTDMVGSQTGRAAEDNIKKIIAEKCAEMGIKYMDITININTNGQNGPEIESVDVTLEKAHEYRHDAIHRELANSLGLKVRLGYADAGESGGPQDAMTRAEGG
ncbi:MAG: stage III sporulation protein AF [Oscillospiraceae bacterium]|nr:stage III sporulation protein AF [Oscillospiraceae bacterium]